MCFHFVDCVPRGVPFLWGADSHQSHNRAENRGFCPLPYFKPKTAPWVCVSKCPECNFRSEKPCCGRYLLTHTCCTGKRNSLAETCSAKWRCVPGENLETASCLIWPSVPDLGDHVVIGDSVQSSG